MGAAHVTEGSRCLVLLSCYGQVSNGIMMAVATQVSKLNAGAPVHTPKGLPSGILSLELIIRQIKLKSLFIMNVPENQYLSVLQRDSIKGDLVLGSLG